MLLWVVLLGVFAAATALDCTGQPDGIYEYTCFSYTRCTQGVAVEIRCNSTDVFDPNQQKCVTPSGGYWPCTNVVNCQTLADSRYPDYNDGCRSYYTCHNGFFYGNNFCPDEILTFEMLILGVLVVIAVAGTGLDAVKAQNPAPAAKNAAVETAPTAAPATQPQLPIYRPNLPTGSSAGASAGASAVNSAVNAGGSNPHLGHPRRRPYNGINPLLLDPDLIYPDHIVDYPLGHLGQLDPLGHLNPLGQLDPLAPGSHLPPLASLGIAEAVYGDLYPSSDYLLQQALLRRTLGAPLPATAAAASTTGAGASATTGATGAGYNGGYAPYDPFIDPYLVGY